MPRSGPIKDPEAQRAKLHESIAELVALQEATQRSAVARLKLEMLRTDIGIIKNNINTIGSLQRSQGKEPDVDNLRQQLAAKLAEYESLKAKYQLEFPKPKRWWQFWK